MANARAKLLGLLLLAAGFAWGLAVGRFEVFPFDLLRAAFGHDGEPAPGRPPPPDRPAGLWVRAGEDDPGPDMETMRRLADLPYLGGYQEAPEEASVTLFRAGEAHDGLNLVVSGHAPGAALVDMDGSTLHTWTLGLRAAWPELDLEGREGFGEFWRRAHVFPDGSLLAIFDGIGMVRIDAASRLVWANPGNYHHDLWLADDGTIYTLSRHPRAQHDELELTGPIEEDFVSILSAQGEELRRVSVLECLVRSDYFPLLASARKQGDLLHANTIERMDGRFADRHPLYAEGNLLVSLPTINTVAVIDIERETTVWALAGMWKFQHQPTILDDGHLLVFDNLGEYGASRVLELELPGQEVTWAYRGDPGRRFSSNFLGSVARLPGGTTLITESAAGRAFEVDPDGERVWEYVNPHRAGDDGELIATLLEVVRIERDYFEGEFAATLAAGGDAGDGRADPRPSNTGSSDAGGTPGG